jgi:hypothetical protein
VVIVSDLGRSTRTSFHELGIDFGDVPGILRALFANTSSFFPRGVFTSAKELASEAGSCSGRNATHRVRR